MTTPCLATFGPQHPAIWYHADAFPGCACPGCACARNGKRKWLPGCQCAACRRAAAANRRHVAEHELSECRVCGAQWWTIGERKSACPQHVFTEMQMRIFADCEPVTCDAEATC